MSIVRNKLTSPFFRKAVAKGAWADPTGHKDTLRTAKAASRAANKRARASRRRNRG